MNEHDTTTRLGGPGHEDAAGWVDSLAGWESPLPGGYPDLGSESLPGGATDDDEWGDPAGGTGGDSAPWGDADGAALRGAAAHADSDPAAKSHADAAADAYPQPQPDTDSTADAERDTASDTEFDRDADPERAAGERGKLRADVVVRDEARAAIADHVPENGTFIELGVAGGHFALQVLRRHPTLHYLGIDKWDDHHNEAERQKAQARLEAYRGRCLLWRLRFDEAASQIPDETAHVVYVDGYAHTGQEGGQTLDDWWPKVRPGGVLAGHDYARRWPATCRAVDRFACRWALPVEIIPEPGGFASWVIRKPHDLGPMLGRDSRVVVVGNGPSLTREARGDDIDTFDEVIRLNRYALTGYEEHTGRRTTIWATVGHGEQPQEQANRPAKVLMVHEMQKPGYRPERVWRIPLSFYHEIGRRVKAKSRWPEEQRQALLPSSGLVVVAWLLEHVGLPCVWVAGIDHFAKTPQDKRHHYWHDRTFGDPPQHDGEAEARVAADWKFQRRWRTLDD